MRGTHKGGRVYHPAALDQQAGPSVTLTDSSPETMQENLDSEDSESHPAGHLDTTDIDERPFEPVPLSDPPLPPSSPPASTYRSDESSTSQNKRKRSALRPPTANSFSLESSPVDSSFSTPQNSDHMGGKRARVTGPVVLNGIKEELTSWRTAYSKNADVKQKNTETKLDLLKGIVSKRTGSDYRRQAREMVQVLEKDRSDAQLVYVMKLLQNDKNAETYVDFIRDSLRREWASEQITEAGIQ